MRDVCYVKRPIRKFMSPAGQSLKFSPDSIEYDVDDSVQVAEMATFISPTEMSWNIYQFAVRVDAKCFSSAQVRDALVFSDAVKPEHVEKMVEEIWVRREEVLSRNGISHFVIDITYRPEGGIETRVK